MVHIVDTCRDDGRQNVDPAGHRAPRSQIQVIHDSRYTIHHVRSMPGIVVQVFLVGQVDLGEERFQTVALQLQ
jgi:hypothetical protein